MTQHGETRNRRTETKATDGQFLTPEGEVTLPMLSVTQTVSEKWCATCRKWVTAKGIMGGLLCVECGTTWS